MVDPIGGFSTNLWSPALDDDEDRLRRAATLTGLASRLAPEPPERPDVHGSLLARVAREAAASSGPRSEPAVDVSIKNALADAELQQQLDLFFERATPLYRVPTGGGEGVEVAVPAPFRMVIHVPAVIPPGTRAMDVRYYEQEKVIQLHTKELEIIGRKYGVSVAGVGDIQAGRGTPSQVAGLTQGLILEDKLPPPEPGVSPELRVRKMMTEYGIGYDCAGYVQQAFLQAHDITRAEAGFLRLVDESLSKLRSSPHFSSVQPEESRPGDIIVLAPPPRESAGHRLIVVDRHDASPVELQRYCATGDGAALAGGRVSVFTVDSSFGSGANPAFGGVQRRTWLYDAVSKNWGSVSPAWVEKVGGQFTTRVPERVTVSSKPYDGEHALTGIYHYTGKH